MDEVGPSHGKRPLQQFSVVALPRSVVSNNFRNSTSQLAILIPTGRFDFTLAAPTKPMVHLPYDSILDSR